MSKIRVPKLRWGGRWLTALNDLDEPCDDWRELTSYAGTSSYQVARSLNLAQALPEPPKGRAFEFGSRSEPDGSSTLLVRCVAVEESVDAV